MTEAEERDSIEAILAGQCAAWTAGDADAFVAGAVDDVSFTNVMGMYTVGLEPFRAQHARIFATIYKGSRMVQKVERIAFVRDDVAIVDTLTGLEGVAHLPPGFAPGDGAPTSRLQQVLVEDARGRGGWRRSTTSSSIRPFRVHLPRAEVGAAAGHLASKSPEQALRPCDRSAPTAALGLAPDPGPSRALSGRPSSSGGPKAHSDPWPPSECPLPVVRHLSPKGHARLFAHASVELEPGEVVALPPAPEQVYERERTVAVR